MQNYNINRTNTEQIYRMPFFMFGIFSHQGAVQAQAKHPSTHPTLLVVTSPNLRHLRPRSASSATPPHTPHHILNLWRT
jgi:hypothetical protein